MKKTSILWLTLLLWLSVLSVEAMAQEKYVWKPLDSLQGKRVLWLGTSISACASYPKVATANLGMTCVNHSVAASYMYVPEVKPPFVKSSGNSLTMSRDEKEAAFRPYVTDGTITQQQLYEWQWVSYEGRVMKDIQDIDLVVIDHGYNDRRALAADYQKGEDQLDWESEDRTSFVGAFRYLYNRILEANPQITVLVGGYFQNNNTYMYPDRGPLVSEVSTWIARHYGLPLLDTWNYTNIPDGFMPNSSQYLKELNEKYGRSFKPSVTDQEGNITYFQVFCPDGVHPHSDPTGHSNAVLDSIVTFLLEERLLRNPGYEVAQEESLSALPHPVGPSHYYSLTGQQYATPCRGISIEVTTDGQKHVVVR